MQAPKADQGKRLQKGVISTTDWNPVGSSSLLRGIPLSAAGKPVSLEILSHPPCLGRSCGSHQLVCGGPLKTKAVTTEAPELCSEYLCVRCFAFVSCVHNWCGLLSSTVTAPCKMLAQKLLGHGCGLFQQL